MLSNDRVAVSLAIGTPIAFAALGGTLPGDSLTTWYPTLRKSKLVLPLWAFMPVAVLYYVMCGLVLFRLLARVKVSPHQRMALALLLIVMAANEGWNYLLFGRRSTQAGLWGMIGFTTLTIALVRVLHQVDQQSAALVRAYLVWLGYDVVYAFELWRLNRG